MYILTRMLRVTSIDEVLSHAARKSRSKPGILGVSGLLYTDPGSCGARPQIIVRESGAIGRLTNRVTADRRR